MVLQCSQRNDGPNNLLAHELVSQPASIFDFNQVKDNLQVELARRCVVIWVVSWHILYGTGEDFLSNFRDVEPPSLVHPCVSGLSSMTTNVDV